ncbi:hypothetical protein FXO37_28104 [Capsicum annuum]|nr:hypothetical protein FXO37_28104 [Capsicum annuum]
MAACTCPKYVPRIIEVLSVDGSSGQQIGSSTFDPSTAEKSWVSPTERYAVVPDENVPRQAVIPVRGSGNDKSSKSLWNFWLGKIKRLEGLLDFLGNSAAHMRYGLYLGVGLGRPLLPLGSSHHKVRTLRFLTVLSQIQSTVADLAVIDIIHGLAHGPSRSQAPYNIQGANSRHYKLGIKARIQDFTRMYPPSFTGSSSEEDPQEFLEQVQKVTNIIGVTSSESAEFFPLELREAKVLESINLRQGSMSVKEYSLEFTQLARLMVHSQKIEEQKLKKKERENKRARSGSFNFSQPKLEGGNHSQSRPKFSVLTPFSASVPMTQDSVSNGCTNPFCRECGKNHKGVCRFGSDVCFGCGKPGHRVRDFPQSGSQGQYSCLSAQSGRLN